ncbi:MAG: hypothetical protein V3U93_06860, partial [Alphaproteobacteria bacterium]
GSPGSLRRSPDAQASRFTPRLPGKPICRHQIDSIWSDSALSPRRGQDRRDAPVDRAGDAVSAVTDK